jgi:multiple sugar transport system permease protein
MTTATGPRRPDTPGPLSVGGAMVFLVLMAGYFLMPVYWLLVNATKSQRDLVTTNGFAFADVQLGRNLADLFARDDGVFGRWALIGFALGGVLVPATALALPLFLMFAGVGLTNTYWAVLLPSIVSPFGVYLSRVYASASVPDELIDAGRMDGAGELRIFFTVAVRLMAPALVTVFLFQFVAIWNNFLLPLIMLQDSSLYPITYGLYLWASQVSRDPALQVLAIVGSLVSVIPLIITFVSLQRFWRSGLAAGSVK